MAGNIGSAEWFTGAADKLIDRGLDVLQYKLSGVNDTSKTTIAENTTSVSSLSSKLPLILGGIAVVGIALILIKR